jgi:hypothetical protein
MVGYLGSLFHAVRASQAVERGAHTDAAIVARRVRDIIVLALIAKVADLPDGAVVLCLAHHPKLVGGRPYGRGVAVAVVEFRVLGRHLRARVTEVGGGGAE